MPLELLQEQLGRLRLPVTIRRRTTRTSRARANRVTCQWDQRRTCQQSSPLSSRTTTMVTTRALPRPTTGPKGLLAEDPRQCQYRAGKTAVFVFFDGRKAPVTSRTRSTCSCCHRAHRRGCDRDSLHALLDRCATEEMLGLGLIGGAATARICDRSSSSVSRPRLNRVPASELVHPQLLRT